MKEVKENVEIKYKGIRKKRKEEKRKRRKREFVTTRDGAVMKRIHTLLLSYYGPPQMVFIEVREACSTRTDISSLPPEVFYFLVPFLFSFLFFLLFFLSLLLQLRTPKLMAE